MSESNDHNILGRLSPAKGSRRRRKIIGRGEGSGKGKTSGRGMKGQKARRQPKVGFEGGQMPLIRRVPKFGFTPRNRKFYNEISLAALNRVEGTAISAHSLQEAGLVKDLYDGVAVLGTGDIRRALTLRVQKISGPAKAKIEAAGGKVEIVDLQGRAPKPKFIRRKYQKSIRRAERTAEAIKSRPVSAQKAKAD